MTKKERFLLEETYYVQGMHCASCELIVERKLLEQKGIVAVDASLNRGEVRVECEGEEPDVKDLNRLFKKEGYTFSNQPFAERASDSLSIQKILRVGGVSLLLIAALYLVNRTGLSGLSVVDSGSSLPLFFVFGLLAGLSSCAALVGGIVLSMTKQWSGLYSNKESLWVRLQPNLLFNLGRLVSYAVFGAALGMIGGVFRVSATFSSVLVFLVSIVMIILALQMLGVRASARFQPTMPRFILRYVADESNFKGRFLPFLVGAFTFFLPCGFTLTTQGLAVASGTPLQGALVMFFFALGTSPSLLTIGIASMELSKKPHLSELLSRVAGILVLFFAFSNINAQFNALGFTSLSDLYPRGVSGSPVAEEGFAPIVEGKQILKMDALAYGYEPAYFKVRAGVAVRWEIADKGFSGCTNAILSRDLFEGQVDLLTGGTTIKEFTPENPGEYKFSCWMGMASGVIEVIDPSTDSGPAQSRGVNASGGEVSSRAQGCGCG
ncbi:MAG: sulfite exporter TauE/SafE family protein [Anaerolineae bacterium]|nr:sulfite exporter TauE/SafE family protein [Anaerolineae bacterium]